MVTSKVLGGAAVAAVLSIVATEACAKPGFAIVSLSPATFVSNCQSMGGTSSSAPNGGIRCTLPSGQTVDCSFNTSDGTAVCQWTRDLPPKSSKQLMGDPLPGSMNPSVAPSQPKATGAPATVN